jgi:hypothetical protein
LAVDPITLLQPAAVLVRELKTHRTLTTASATASAIACCIFCTETHFLVEPKQQAHRSSLPTHRRQHQWSATVVFSISVDAFLRMLLHTPLYTLMRILLWPLLLTHFITANRYTCIADMYTFDCSWCAYSSMQVGSSHPQ